MSPHDSAEPTLDLDTDIDVDAELAAANATADGVAEPEEVDDDEGGAPVKKPPLTTYGDKHRNPALEEMLRSRGFDFTYQSDVPLQIIDENKSLKNQARVSANALIAETVSTYTAALENGDIFPAVMAAGNITQIRGLVIVDGNHRYAAFKKAGAKTIPVYYIQGASQANIIQLTYEANTKHGVPLTKDERIQHALWLVNSGFSAQKAATLLNVDVNALRGAIKLDQANRRVVETGINRPKWDNLPEATRKRLHQVEDNSLFAKLTSVAIDAGLSSTEVAKVVTNVNGLRDHEKKKVFVDKIRDAHRDRIQTGGVRPPKGSQTRTGRMMLQAFLNQAAVLPSPESIALGLRPEDKTAFIQEINTTMRTLDVIKAALSE